MTPFPAIRTALTDRQSIRQWISRAFIVSILAYLVVIGYLIAESVRGASKWAPYGVNMPVFITLIVASEVIITATAVWIFREDSGIWPKSIADGWRTLRSGSVLKGVGAILVGAWDIPIIDLRLRTTTAIVLARVNRIAALAPLAYALVASANTSAPWGLRSSALIDVALTLGVWAFMEIVMVQPETAARNPERLARTNEPSLTTGAARRAKSSRYKVRRLVARDVPRIEEIEQLKWREQAATRDLIEQRLTIYPQGQIAAIHERVIDGEVTHAAVAAWITVMAATKEHVASFNSWERVTSNGTIRDCDPKGDVLIGVNLTSVTEGATYMLVGEALASVVAWGKSTFIGGARLNGFVAFNEHRAGEGKRPLTAQEYATLREIRGHRINEHRIDDGMTALDDAEYVALAGQIRSVNGEPPLDGDAAPDYVCSNLRGYMSIPGARMVEVVPDYFDDPSSDDWGVVIDWTNPIPAPLRKLPILRTLAANRVRSEVRKEWDDRSRRLREKARQRTKAKEVAATPAIREAAPVAVA